MNSLQHLMMHWKRNLANSLEIFSLASTPPEKIGTNFQGSLGGYRKCSWPMKKAILTDVLSEGHFLN